ncbi:MAG: class I SAM-dependent methyltransferase, partial [Flavobacteriales bacterium]|nr:class I SAM-dependent methyltransferase [Flavobacteriales bacterium]
GSTSSIPLEDHSIDVVISFETLEHHDEHEEMMMEVKRVLKPEGVLLISTPDKYFYSDLRSYKNQYHVKELYKPQFINLISKYFSNYQIFTQSYISGNSIIIEDSKRDYFEFYSGSFEKLETITSYPQFLIAQCSNSKLKAINDSIFDGKQLLDSKILEKQLKYVYNSNSYKVGNFILKPFKAIQKFFKFK